MSLLVLFLIFQAAWFAIVLGGAAGTSLWGALAAAMVLVLLSRRYGAADVLRRAAMGVSLGIVLDSALLFGGMTAFPAHDGELLPIWMLALWANFAAILPFMVPWLAGRRGLAVLCGAAGGPAAYYSAELLGAIEVAGLSGYLAVGAAWAVAMAGLPLSASTVAPTRPLGREATEG
jgi:hypothetical protein